jgi:hypothetical protein
MSLSRNQDDTACFQAFLDVLSRKFARQYTLLVVDGAPNHHSGGLAVPDNITLLLPSPSRGEHLPPDIVCRTRSRYTASHDRQSGKDRCVAGAAGNDDIDALGKRPLERAHAVRQTRRNPAGGQSRSRITEAWAATARA